MDKTDYYMQASKKRVRVIDWLALRNEYETTSISQRKLSKKHKVNWYTLKDRAYKEKWGKTKKDIQEDIKQKTTKKTIENISDNKSKALEKHYKISEYFLYKMGNALKNEKEFNTFVEKVKDGRDTETVIEFTLNSMNDKKMLNMVNAFEKIQKAQRQTLGIVDADKLTRSDKLKEFEHRKDIDNKKLIIEEKKINYEEMTEDKNEKAIKAFIEATKASDKELNDIFEDE